MTVDTLELRKHSVTRDDVGEGGPLTFLVAPLGPQHVTPGLPPRYSKARDMALTATLDLEDMWASAVYKTITKRTARGWEVKDSKDSTTRVKRAQQLLLRFDGTRYVPGMSKVLQDFLLTDNGAFVEVVRATKAPGSRILGLMHLDSFQCERTGDPQVPVLYKDGAGREHELKDYQVLSFVDQPSPRVRDKGTGRCSGGRAFRTIITLSAIQIYFREKVTGDRNLAIHIVNGISPDQLQGALSTAREEHIQRGYTVYKGSVVIPAIKVDQNLSVVTIPLAEIPDGFDVDQERRDAYLRYANALGVPVQDIQPLSGQGLGTGTQTVILSEEAEGLGLAAFDRDFTHALNDFVFPETTTFIWTNPHDMRDQKAKAEVDKMKADAVKAMTGDATNPGPITNEQGLNLLVDWNVVPREFLPPKGDQTPGGTLSDEEKPVSEEREIAAPAEPTVQQKAIDPYQDLIDWVARQPNLGDALAVARAYLAAKEKEAATLPRWTPQLAAAIAAGAMTEEQGDQLMAQKAIHQLQTDLGAKLSALRSPGPHLTVEEVETEIKERRGDTLIDSEWERAMEWAKKVME